jgi:hypothetical protein
VIVRILGEGQFRVDDETAAKLTALDKDLDAAVRDDQGGPFTAALHAAVALVQAVGTPLGADEIVTADYILPFADATVDEVRKLLADGTIPGDSIGLPLPAPASGPGSLPRAAAHGESSRFAVGRTVSGVLRQLSGTLQRARSVVEVDCESPPGARRHNLTNREPGQNGGALWRRIRGMRLTGASPRG